ncbi:MAG: carbohydrate kinase family protein [Christensenellaceae bacterium]|nr:carbohydrate kinase family protein [Christensenellaceae bacterium]
MKDYDVVALGIAVMDIVAAPVDRNLFEHNKMPVDSVILAPGGDAANQASHLARLGWRTELCCRLGEDALSRMFTAELAACGVDLSHAAVSPESVMTAAVVLVAADGQRSILHRRGNNYDFCREDVDLNIIAGARALTVGSIYGCPRLDEDGLEQILTHAKAHGVTTFADMATDKRGLKLAGLKPLLPHIDWFMPSEAESRYLTDGMGCEEAARVFLDMGARNVVIKLGERGAYACGEGYTGYVDVFEIDAVDTTGSGDAFCAGLIHSLLSGRGAVEALTFACACGAYNALYKGAAAATLNRPAVEDFIRKTKRRPAGGRR